MTSHAPPLEALLAHRAWVRALACRLADNAVDADDLEQDAWLAAARARPHDGIGIRAWFAKVMRNRAAERHRLEVRRTTRESVVARPEETSGGAALVVDAEAHARVVLAVLALDDPYRETVLLRFYEGLPPREVAARMGVPVDTVRTRLRRAAETLRAALGGERDDWLGALAPLLDVRRGAPVPTAAVAVGVAMKKIIVVSLVVLLAAGAMWWTASRLLDETGRTAGDREVGVAAAPTPAAREPALQPAVPAPGTRSRTPSPVPTTAAPGDEIPPPVDLKLCDREIDLFGIVADESGGPVVGALVRTASHPWAAAMAAPRDLLRTTEDGPTTRAARDGTFALHLRRGAVVDLRVTAKGFADAVRTNCQAGERVTVTLVRGASLEVTTVDERGRPVPKVRVHTFAARRSGLVTQERDGTTDAAGRVVFDGLIAGTVFLSAQHPELSPAEAQRAEIPSSGSIALQLTMLAGRTIRGRVTDAATGAPIAGARVDATGWISRSVTTDAEGRYVLPGWTGKEGWFISAAAPGRVSVEKTVPGAGDVDLALRAGDGVTARVVRADGTPVEGAYVTASGGARYWSSTVVERYVQDVVSARTGADGRFALAGLQHEVPHVLVVAAEGLGRVLVDVVPPAAAGGEVDLGDVVLREGRAIDGVAVDGDGAPIAGALVSLSDGSDDAEHTARILRANVTVLDPRRTDDLGRFRFTDLAAGPYRLILVIPDAPSTPVDPSITLVLPPDRDVTGVKLQAGFDRTATIAVVDERGIALAGFVVRTSGYLAESGPSYLMSLTGRTGDDGRLTLRGLSARPTWFHVDPHWTQKGFFGATVGPVVPAGQEVRVTVKRAAAGADEVAAEEPTGEPSPAGRTLTVVVLDSAGGAMAGVRVGPVRGPGKPATTDAAGRAEITGLPAEDVTIAVSSSDAWAPARALDVPPAPVRVMPAGQVVTMDCRAGVALRGRIIGSSYAPLGDLLLAISSSEDDRYGVRVDSSGRFTAGVLADVPHVLRATRNGDGFVLRGVVAGPDELIVTAGPNSR